MSQNSCSNDVTIVFSCRLVFFFEDREMEICFCCALFVVFDPHLFVVF